MTGTLPQDHQDLHDVSLHQRAHYLLVTERISLLRRRMSPLAREVNPDQTPAAEGKQGSEAGMRERRTLQTRKSGGFAISRRTKNVVPISNSSMEHLLRKRGDL